ncbi:hypothetical protein D0T53_09255 [Dysgonomonas sp. 216]|uniref:hypothetical protein n=1 Tax=Dysgonomonas sp. 216 TaxID=2302934 RepID=UPI0013D707E9|nr:hypothetical protein [Dysgonomonas sp. 216]NDW19099.1 hypothetical protein [Dysgonomonas sp. 216]
MGCKLTASITKDNCCYSVAGIKALYLFNYNTANTYELEEDLIKAISLSGSDRAYKVEYIEGSASWSDELAVNGNGGKYRTHTVNFTLSEYDYKLLNQADALSLGKFTVVVVDKSGRVVILGRNNGLSATSFNYASGAADADANGWTTVLTGTEMEVGKLLKNENVIASLVDTTMVEA